MNPHSATKSPQVTQAPKVAYINPEELNISKIEKKENKTEKRIKTGLKIKVPFLPIKRPKKHKNKKLSNGKTNTIKG